MSSVPNWLFLIFVAFFVALWCGVTTVLDLMAGHRERLRRFPPVEDSIEPSFHFASGGFRKVHYTGALYVGIGRRGLHLASNAMFRSPFLRGIPCIPWSEIRRVEPASTGFHAWFGGKEFEVPAVNVAFTVYGRAARAIEERLAIRSESGIR